MAVYVAEPLNMSDLETLFTDNWDTRTNGEIPVPLFAQSDQTRFETIADSVVSAVNIQAEELSEEYVGYPLQHVSRRLPVLLDIWTRRESAGATGGGIGRQYLHDVKQEIRRICFANKFSLTNWHVIRYKSFKEIFEDSAGIRHHGQIRIELEQSTEDAPVSEIVTDDFNRSDAAIGANWTDVAGTWEVVSNKAALQSATANAHTRYTGSTLKSSVRLQVDLVTAASMDAGLVFRWADSSNYWRAVLVDEAGTKYVRVIARVGGVDSKRFEYLAGSTAFTWTDGDQVELVVNMQQALLEVSVNGALVFSREDTFEQAETDHGMYSGSDQNTRFENFRVDEAGGHQ